MKFSPTDVRVRFRVAVVLDIARQAGSMLTVTRTVWAGSCGASKLGHGGFSSIPAMGQAAPQAVSVVGAYTKRERICAGLLRGTAFPKHKTTGRFFTGILTKAEMDQLDGTRSAVVLPWNNQWAASRGCQDYTRNQGVATDESQRRPSPGNGHVLDRAWGICPGRKRKRAIFSPMDHKSVAAEQQGGERPFPLTVAGMSKIPESSWLRL